MAPIANRLEGVGALKIDTTKSRKLGVVCIVVAVYDNVLDLPDVLQPRLGVDPACLEDTPVDRHQRVARVTDDALAPDWKFLRRVRAAIHS